ncbi:gliding motility-associated C-terminal domain-containing protein [Aquimarina agarilytica]|uniref:gliding motility-associated C-terminal domain-containing protein n=1 Tax=Aquimarina agarilytica TaxID=1087449 RepID=UPI0002891B2C|nr:gliding motility-associated C-terminal domain-containing protein [Aquimarina agarilytica]
MKKKYYNYFFSRKNTSFFVLFLLLMSVEIFAQFDTEYYLPPLWSTNNLSTNTPTKLIVSTTFLESEVTIQNANGLVFGSAFIVRNNQPLIIDLSVVLGNTNVFNTVENSKGLLIKSTNPIQAVHVNDSPHNKTYTVLKGKSALGKEFYAASQVKVLAEQYRKDETHFISVMATEDNTQVTIQMPVGKELEGIGNSITVNLDANESYLVKNEEGTNIINNITGAHITATKDIAVLSGGQHIRQNKGIGGAAEGGVDQLVPVKVLGTEYILNRGGTALDYAIVVATEPNTKVYLDGGKQAIDISKSGDFVALDYSEETRQQGLKHLGTPYYIDSNKPIYVYHVSGLFSDEVGMALIPTVGCTGSKKINFLKFKSGNNIASIIIEDEGVSDFLFNGKLLKDLNIIPKKVPGKEGWSIVSIPNELIKESNVAFSPYSFFYLGLLVASPGSGTYGMLSGFDKKITAIDPNEKLPIETFEVTPQCDLRARSIVIPLELEFSCGVAEITVIETEKEESSVTFKKLDANNFELNYNAGISSFVTDTVMVSFESKNNGVFQASGQVEVKIIIPPNANKDGDKLPDCIDPDDDNDGIPDITEYLPYNVAPFGDEDGDGVQNFQDVFDDGDLGDASLTVYTDANLDDVPDIYDFDNDGFPNHIDLDSDGDGIPDNVEFQWSNTYILPSNRDSDFDGIDDSYSKETKIANTTKSTFPDFLNTDSDNDGFSDLSEAFFIDGINQSSIFIGDADHDGLDDFFDAEIGSFKSPNGAQVVLNPINDLKNSDDTDEPNFRDLDDDNDQLKTTEEVILKTDPFNPDTDNDGLSDGEEVTGVDHLSTFFIALVKSNPIDVCDPLKLASSCDQDGDGNINKTDPNPEIPVAENDFIEIREGSTVEAFNVLENDDFLPGKSVNVYHTGKGTAKGAILFKSNQGVLNYIPFQGEVGVVTIVYEVCNQANDLKVCAKATIEINIKEEKDLVVYNAVSPNGDGRNDYFIIEGITSLEDFPSNDVMIFNSIGEVVYKEANYKGDLPQNSLSDYDKSFKGLAKNSLTYANNEELPRGTYFYEINYTVANGNSKVKTGYLYMHR